MVIVRRRETADLDACVAALRAVWKDSGYPTIWPRDPAGWLSPSRTAAAWVAQSPGVPVAGHLIMRSLPPGQDPWQSAGQAAEVARLFVVPAARRQGVARALLRTAADWAAARDLDLVLEVTAELRDARALYESAGFRHLGSVTADWTAPDGSPVTLHRYARGRPGLKGGLGPDCLADQ